jgi:hypothetical protein
MDAEKGPQCAMPDCKECREEKKWFRIRRPKSQVLGRLRLLLAIIVILSLGWCVSTVHA